MNYDIFYQYKERLIWDDGIREIWRKRKFTK